MRHVEGAVEVDGDDVVPILEHRRGLAGERVAAVDAGIVDQDRHRPELRGNAFGDRDAVLAPGDIEREARGLAAGLADFLRGLLGRLGVDVDERDLRALAGVAGRDRAPDSGAGAGHDRDMVFEQGHGGFLMFRF